MTPFLITIMALALIFDYINGFHDAANSIATVVSTKVLTPFQAVLWAAVFNSIAFFIFKDHGVADTVAKTVKPDHILEGNMMVVIFSGLIAAIAWNFTWWLGIPSSSSHTLIGGFAGAAIAAGGFEAVNSSIIIRTASFIFLAPLIGMVMAFIMSLWFLSCDDGETVGLFEPIMVSEGSPVRSGLNDLVLELAEKSAAPRSSLPASIAEPLADLVRAMNCYYSNLIEGHDTHPIDIERAMRNDYSADPKKRNLQLEAKAHVAVQKWIDEDSMVEPPTAPASIIELHRRLLSIDTCPPKAGVPRQIYRSMDAGALS